MGIFPDRKAVIIHSAQNLKKKNHCHHHNVGITSFVLGKDEQRSIKEVIKVF